MFRESKAMIFSSGGSGTKGYSLGLDGEVICFGSISMSKPFLTLASWPSVREIDGQWEKIKYGGIMEL